MKQPTALVILGILILAGTVSAQVPRTVIAEVLPDYSGFNPVVVDGLAVVEAALPRHEFNYIHGITSGSVLACPDTERLATYYDTGSYPLNLFWDGYDRRIAFGDFMADGELFRRQADNHLRSEGPVLVVAAPLVIEGDLLTAEATILTFADVEDAVGVRVRMMLLEDDVACYDRAWDHMLRGLQMELPFTAGSAGDRQTVTAPFELDPAWDVSKLSVVTVVQRDSDRHILNSTTTRTAELRTTICQMGARQEFAHDGVARFDTTGVVNTGRVTETYDLTLETSGLPDGWSAVFYLDGVAMTSATVTLAPAEAARLVVEVETGGAVSGCGNPRLVVASQSTGEVRAVTDLAVTPAGTDVIVISEGTLESAAAYGEAVLSTGRTCGTWSLSHAPIDSLDLGDYGVVVWETAGSQLVLETAERAALGSYLDQGGFVLLAGRNVLRGLDSQPGGLAWAADYLHVTPGPRFALWRAYGVDDDPIGDGLVVTQVQETGDSPLPTAGEPVDLVFHDASQRPVGVRVDGGGYRAVYCSFGFENIVDPAVRDALVQRALSWLETGGVTGAAVPPRPAVLEQNAPNPFNPTTTIGFSLPQAGPAELDVFDAAGRLVRVLVREDLPAGTHRAVWNGRDHRGARVASGLYFYRLVTGEGEVTRSMSLVK